MKRTIGILVTFLALGMVVSYAQEEGFWTRGGMIRDEEFRPKACSIECWRARFGEVPRRYASWWYNPDQVPYLHWWNGGDQLHLDYNWWYMFIAVLPIPEHNDTLFSDWSPYRYYQPEVHDTFDLVLQYSTTRPTPPPLRP